MAIDSVVNGKSPTANFFSEEDANQLEGMSILRQVDELLRPKKQLNLLPLGAASNPQDQLARSKASTWLSIYPNSMVTNEGKSALSAVADLIDADVLTDLGIKGIYLTPINTSGGVQKKGDEVVFTPSTDGNFDPISLEVDANLGGNDGYKELVYAVRKKI